MSEQLQADFGDLGRAPTGQVRAHRDPVAGAKARDDALDALERHRKLAIGRLNRAIRACARLANGGTFSTDDVWAFLGDGAESIGEPRAMGAAMRMAAEEGLIEATNEFRPSDRPACHRRPVRLWRAA